MSFLYIKILTGEFLLFHYDVLEKCNSIGMRYKHKGDLIIFFKTAASSRRASAVCTIYISIVFFFLPFGFGFQKSAKVEFWKIKFYKSLILKPIPRFAYFLFFAIMEINGNATMYPSEFCFIDRKKV